MALFKCKMCGGELEVDVTASICQCPYCGSQQTLPKLHDDNRNNLYGRANHFRRNNDYDKAMNIYEQILNQDDTDAEAYWSIVLCRYGIEYVVDPTTEKRVPTINRVQLASIYADEDYKSAIKYANEEQRPIYEAEAGVIDNILKGYLEISKKEKPFDVFICYKETDSSGERTHDSVLAQDLYYGLKEEGFKVFFARITLEDKLGSAYEPYIFAALNSAKVMVALGTKPEYFTATWVKNEWSRYLTLMKKDSSKMLIPAYKGMDAYDLPEEFSHLQAQDMSKLGFMQDLIRGIKKIIGGNKEEKVVQQVVSAGGGNTSALLKRANMFLEDGDFTSADEYAEKVLDINPECAEAYVVKLMVSLSRKDVNELYKYGSDFSTNLHFQKALRFASDELRAKLIEQQKHRYYDIACGAMSCIADHLDTKNYQMAENNFKLATGYSDADQLLDNLPTKLKSICYKKAENAIKKNCKNDYSELMTDKFYNEIYSLYRAAKDYENAEEKFKKLPSLRDEAFANTARVYMYQSQWNTSIETAQKYIDKVSDSKIKKGLNDEYANQLKVYNYYWASQYLEMDSSKEVDKAIRFFKELGDYEDSPQKLNEAKKKFNVLKKKENLDEHNAQIDSLKKQIEKAKADLAGAIHGRKIRLSDERTSFIAAIVHFMGIFSLVFGILLLISSISDAEIIPIKPLFSKVQVFIERQFEIAVDTNIPVYISIGFMVLGFIAMQVGSIIISVVNFGLWYLAFIGTCMYDVYIFCVIGHFFGYFKAKRNDSGKQDIARCNKKIEELETKLKNLVAKGPKTVKGAE